MSWKWLKDAFAVEPEGPPPLNEAQREAVDRVCREVVRRRLAVPALAFLEMSRPLNFVGAQALHFFQPFLSVFTDSQSPQRFAAFLEHRGSVEHLCRRIEAFQQEADGKASPGSER